MADGLPLTCDTVGAEWFDSRSKTGHGWLVCTVILTSRTPVVRQLVAGASYARAWVFTHPGQTCRKVPLSLFFRDLDYIRRSPDALLVFSYLGRSSPKGQPVENEALQKHKATLLEGCVTAPSLLSDAWKFAC